MARAFHRLIALVAGAVVGSAATTCGGSAYGPDCDVVGAIALTCWGRARAEQERAACEACAYSGGYVNVDYLNCFADQGDCQDTTDTDTQQRIEACTVGKSWCE